MKKSKIICLILCTLMIVTVFPVVGLPIQSQETRIVSTTQPPGPAYAPMPRVETRSDVPRDHEHPQTTTTSMDEIVISMIEQVDESIYMMYLENLTAFGPRPTESSACIAAADYMYNQFQSMGLATRYCHWDSYGYSSDNVEATLNGTDETSDEIYIVCAHYDTVSSGPGADDDTSGTVAVLIAASVMSQYKFNHTIKFVCFSGEEQGLLGSGVYASEAASQGWNIIGVLNCDMISYAITSSDGSNLLVYINTASQWLFTYTDAVSTEYAEYIQLTLHQGGAPPGGSDHESFWYEGYDALFYFEYTMTPYYHSAQDTIAHINASYAAKNVRLAIATLAELGEAGLLSNPPETPLLTGPDMGVIDEPYSFTAVTTDPDGEDIYYFFEWGDGTTSGWLGPYPSGNQASAEKTWSNAGNYTIRVKAKDINQVSSGWSLPLIIMIVTDRAPDTPTITGPAEGAPGNTYLYKLSTIDPDEDTVFYFIDWGDGQVSEWIGPYTSGAIATITHQWSEEGTYTIKAKAKDNHDIESDWATLDVTMPISVEKYQGTLLYHILQYISQLLENLGLRLNR